MEANLEQYELGLNASGYTEDHRTKKVIRYRLNDQEEWIYVSITRNSPSLVIHPKYLDLFDNLSMLPGVFAQNDGNESFKYSTNISKFPKRLNKGRKEISYGLEFKAESLQAVSRFITALHSTESSRLEDIEIASVEAELQELDSTEREEVIKARRGQGKFRASLVDRYRKCQLSGCETLEALRASHIKPWVHSSNTERLDPANGLLLRADIDAIFDCGLISFDQNGKIILSNGFDITRLHQFGLRSEATISDLTTDTAGYLVYHREFVLIRVAV